MAEKKELTTINYVTDCDTGMHYMGEVDGMMHFSDIEDFLKTFGEKGKTDLINHLAFLQHQVIKSWMQLRERQSIEEITAATKADT